MINQQLNLFVTNFVNDQKIDKLLKSLESSSRKKQIEIFDEKINNDDFDNLKSNDEKKNV